MKRLVLFMLSWSLPAWALASTSPSSLVMSIFEIRLSQNSDCSNSVSIFKTASPTAVDLVANPTLGSGAIPKGTYHCIAIHLKDLVTITPLASDGVSCQAGVPFSLDIFNTPSQGDVSVDPVTGATINGTGTPTSFSEDDPWIYFTDASFASSSNSCYQPTLYGTNWGPCRFSAVPITGSETHTLVYDFDNAVLDRGNGHCEVNGPSISIR